MYAHRCTCVYVDTCTCTIVHAYVYVYVVCGYVHVYAYLYLCVCICIYMCMYVSKGVRSSLTKGVLWSCYLQVSKQVTVKQPTITSHTEKVVDSTNKSQKAGGGQPHKDSETTASSLPQSEKLTNTSAAIEAEVAKNTMVNNQTAEKAHSNISTDKVIIYTFSFSFSGMISSQSLT